MKILCHISDRITTILYYYESFGTVVALFSLSESLYNECCLMHKELINSTEAMSFLILFKSLPSKPTYNRSCRHHIPETLKGVIISLGDRL